MPLFLLSACAMTPSEPSMTWPESDPRAAVPALNVEANWKERLATGYVFVQHSGDYRRMGEAMRQLFGLASDLDLEANGPPFALFFDDPGRVDTAELRARACLPVKGRPPNLGRLQFDVLPRAMVVYGRVAGAYSEVPRSYPALFSYLQSLGRTVGGPVREIYLVNPAEAASHAELMTEVQIPWGVADASVP